MPKHSSLSKEKKPAPKQVVSKKGKKPIVKTHSLRNKLIGILFFALAIIILIAPQLMPKKALDNKNPIKINSALYSSKNIANDPIRILIPKADIDLKVIDAPIVNGYWQLSENTASYGLGSGTPGTKSNTVIFAHARQGLFYNLKDVKLNDIVYIFTKNQWYRYRVNKIIAVYPNQTEVIKPTKSEVLTLYTCTGFYDEKRLIVTAVPQN
jgi:LPXTG-site transpeptidase (sortase) family protein